MRLPDSILLSLSVVFFIIGVHQVMTLGLTYAYSMLMLSVLSLLWYRIRKKKASQQKIEGQHEKNRKKVKQPKRKSL